MDTQVIESIRKDLQVGSFQNEAAVTSGVVYQVLQALGWPVFNTHVVCPQFTVSGGRVDVALCHPPDKPRVFIEVKQVGQAIGAEQQLFQYAFHLGVPLVVLTDGAAWSFFVPSGEGDYSERCVYKLDLMERGADESVQRFNRYLHFDAVKSGSALSAAKDDYADVKRTRDIRDVLPKAWHKLAEDGYDLLLDLLAERAESLCGYKPDPDTVTRFLEDNIRLVVLPSAPPPSKPLPTSPGPVAPSSPSTDQPAIGFTLGGQFTPCKNGRQVLTSVIERLAASDSTFLQKFVALPKHGSKRRFIAVERNELYPGRPDLAQQHSQQLQSGYWLGTNCSKPQIHTILKMACAVRGLTYGTDLKVNLGASF